MGPIWDRQDPGGPHVGPMNLAIWEYIDDEITLVLNDLPKPIDISYVFKLWEHKINESFYYPQNWH